VAVAGPADSNGPDGAVVRLVGGLLPRPAGRDGGRIRLPACAGRFAALPPRLLAWRDTCAPSYSCGC